MISFADFAFSSHFLVMLLSLAVSCSRELLRTFTWYQTSPPGLASGHLGSFLGYVHDVHDVHVMYFPHMP